MSMTLDAITLPDELIWIDEFDYTGVNNQITKTLSGALIVEESALQKGRFISLHGSDQFACIDRLTLKQLQIKKETANLQMLLTIHNGQSFNVIFRRDVQPLETRPEIDYNDPQDAHFYTLKLNLMEV